MDIRVITFINNKGGVAKSISAISLASILGQRGHKTLLIDTDTQANATSGFGVSVNAGMKTIEDLFFNNVSLEEAATSTRFDNVDVVPASEAFESVVTRLFSEQIDVDRRLENPIRRYIQENEDNPDAYKYIVIDCHAEIDLPVINALKVATDVVIPTSPDQFGLDGIVNIIDKLKEYKRTGRLPHLQQYGILITKYDKRLAISNSMVQQLQNAKVQLGVNVYDVAIPRAVAVDESVYERQPINYYSPKSQPALAYRDFADQLQGVIKNGWK